MIQTIVDAFRVVDWVFDRLSFKEPTVFRETINDLCPRTLIVGNHSRRISGYACHDRCTGRNPQSNLSTCDGLAGRELLRLAGVIGLFMLWLMPLDFLGKFLLTRKFQKSE